jgi:hypothetical protein
MPSDRMPKVRSPFLLGLDADKLPLDQRKMENTGFLWEMILSETTAPFSISGPMQFYSLLRTMNQGTSFL